MKTLGQILRSYREKKRYTLDSLAKKTAIPEPVLEHLENDDHSALPAGPLVRGYILLIAREVNLSEETALALYRRDVETKKTPTNSKKKKTLKRAVSLKNIFVHPRLLSLSVLIVGLCLGSFYAFWQWFSLSQPPQLTVNQPTEQAQLTSPVTVSGKTAADNTVTINTEVVSVDINGNFEYELNLPPGERAIVVTSEDSRGRKSESITFVNIQ